MTDSIKTYKFDEFGPALSFFEQKAKEGTHGILFPRGGDTPRKLAVDPPTWTVILLNSDMEELK